MKLYAFTPVYRRPLLDVLTGSTALTEGVRCPTTPVGKVSG